MARPKLGPDGKLVRPRLEKHEEGDARDAFRARGYLFLKFTSPGSPSVPDRILLSKAPPLLIEAKRPGQKPTEAQKRKMKELSRYIPCTWGDSTARMIAEATLWEDLCEMRGLTALYQSVLEEFDVNQKSV